MLLKKVVLGIYVAGVSVISSLGSTIGVIAASNDIAKSVEIAQKEINIISDQEFKLLKARLPSNLSTFHLPRKLGSIQIVDSDGKYVKYLDGRPILSDVEFTKYKRQLMTKYITYPIRSSISISWLSLTWPISVPYLYLSGNLIDTITQYVILNGVSGKSDF